MFPRFSPNIDSSSTQKLSRAEKVQAKIKTSQAGFMYTIHTADRSKLDYKDDVIGEGSNDVDLTLLLSLFFFDQTVETKSLSFSSLHV